MSDNVTMNQTATPVRQCWMCREREAQPWRRVPPADPAGAFGPLWAFPPAVCRECDERTRPYDEAWSRLARYLQVHWRDISARGSFDLTQIFAARSAVEALNVQLFFVKVLGCKFATDALSVNLASFAAALRAVTPHEEVTVLVADATAPSGRLRMYTADLSVLRQDDEVLAGLWTYLVHPIAFKLCYLKSGAAVRAPDGFPWHPTRQRKIVKLSPFEGDTHPTVARRDLRIIERSGNR